MRLGDSGLRNLAPIISDLDIYRSAKFLIDRHGADALIETALMANELPDAGDLDGQTVH